MRFALLTVAFAGVGLAGCGKSTPAADSAAADKERLQGVWVVERLDTGSPKETERQLKEAGKARFRCEGDTLTLVGLGKAERMSFALDATQNPKRMTTTQPETATQHARTRRWIYKFEGELLVLAYRSDGLDAAPDDFQPRHSDTADVPSVTVVWLRKTNETPP